MRYEEVTADWGTISEYATKMINRFKHLQEANPDVEFQVKGEFNGAILFVDDNSTVESIVSDYHITLERNAEEYRKTDKYKERERQRKEETNKLQTEADNMMERFKIMDKTDTLTLLQWLSDFQQYSDRIDVHTDNQLLLKELKNLGYTSGMNCGDEFKAKDKYNFAAWIVGQCIECLERVGSIHQVVIKFVEDWKKEFIA